MAELGGLVPELEGVTPEPGTSMDCKKYFFLAGCRGSMSKRSIDNEHGQKQRIEQGQGEEQGKDRGQEQEKELEHIGEQNHGQVCGQGCRGEMRKRSEEQEQKFACSKYFFLPGCRGSTRKRSMQEDRAGRRQQEMEKKGHTWKLSSKTFR